MTFKFTIAYIVENKDIDVDVLYGNFGNKGFHKTTNANLQQIVGNCLQWHPCCLNMIRLDDNDIFITSISNTTVELDNGLFDSHHIGRHQI